MENAAHDWFLQAEADFDSAEYNLAGGKYYAVVIFAQQAAEKALKAVYILKKKKLPPKIHDLVELCRLIEAPRELFGSAEELSVSYLVSRYPGVAPEIPLKYYTKIKALALLNKAKEVVTWTRKALKK